jgi:hypothetical protein
MMKTGVKILTALTQRDNLPRLSCVASIIKVEVYLIVISVKRDACVGGDEKIFGRPSKCGGDNISNV